MNILVIGSGGREHALCWKLAASPILTSLYCAPGNGGIADEAECVDMDVTDHAAVIAFCVERKIDLVIVGPEAPLVAGMVDDLEAAGIRAFGPSKAASQLEASKGFTKDLCARHNIPTGSYERFSEAEQARAYVRAQGAPIVVKADGLAAGKGVTVAMTEADAIAAIDEAFGGRFGDAGLEVVVEEFLEGEEASFFVLTDGVTSLPLATAQDHKPVGEGDTGPNTGGMGAYSPAPVMTDEMCARAMSEIIEPTVRGMAAEGMPFRGILFAGFMIGSDGPKLIEYNVRFGDPECQVLMARLKSDLLLAIVACMDGVLKNVDLRWHDDPAVAVVMATNGYPGSVKNGSEIKGLADAWAMDGVTVFHAGTKRDGDRILANGGRVLGVTASGGNVTEAQKRAYDAVDRIDWPEGFCRRDIGWRAVEREQG
jgi:phosphoribosylamine--glycine ligase